ncbi:Hsp70 family protein [Nocardia sp. alder85J]|nr:Hsp70 family protein [Nocardia sp. alder85J]
MPSAVVVESPAVVRAGVVVDSNSVVGDLISRPKQWIAAGTTEFQLRAGVVSAAEIVAAVLREVSWRFRSIADPPTGIVITHPCGWTAPQVGLLAEAARLAGFPADRVRTVPEPVAAVHGIGPVPTGARVAVVDIGATAVNVTVLVAASNGQFHVVVTRSGTGLGGDAVDSAIRRWVDTRLAQEYPNIFVAISGNDPGLANAVASAKEHLTVADSADIEVWSAAGRAALTLGRAEFERLIGPEIAKCVHFVRTVLTQANLTAQELHSVLLIGGAAQVPLLRERLAEALPLVELPEPNTAIVRGAVSARTQVAPIATAGVAPATDRPVFAGAPTGTAPRPAGVRKSGRWIAGAIVAVVLVSAAAVAVALSLTPKGPAASRYPAIDVGMSTLDKDIALDPSSGLAYVSNDRDNTLSVIDTATDKVVATIPVGEAPGPVVVDPELHRVYAVGRGTNIAESNVTAKLSVVDTISKRLITAVPIGKSAHGIALDPSSHNIYIGVDTGTGDPPGAYSSGSVLILDHSSFDVLATVPGGDNTPWAIAIDPVTRTAYFAGVARNQPGNPVGIMLLNLDTNQLTGFIALPKASDSIRDIAVDPGSRTAFVVDESGSILTVDTKSAVITGTVPVDPLFSTVRTDPVGHIAYAAGGTFDTGRMVAIDTRTGAVVRTVELGRTSASGGAALNAGSGKIYVPCGSMQVRVIPR